MSNDVKIDVGNSSSPSVSPSVSPSASESPSVSYSASPSPSPSPSADDDDDVDIEGITKLALEHNLRIAGEFLEVDIPISYEALKSNPIKFQPQTNIRVNNKTFRLPKGFAFFYDLNGLWLIRTVGEMEERFGKKIGLIDMLAEFDVTLNKDHLEFIEQQARLLEARAHTYRIVARAKSNNGHRKES